MTACTDDERREVARRLRGLEACELDGEFIDCGEVEDALGLVSDGGAWYEAEGVMRLADLIEPTDGFDLDTVARVCFECLEGCDEPEYTLYDTILTAITCYKHGESGLPLEMLVDRESLLALADELEEDACWEVQTPGDTSGAWRLKDACDRIREALGVVE